MDLFVRCSHCPMGLRWLEGSIRVVGQPRWAWQLWIHAWERRDQTSDEAPRLELSNLFLDLSCLFPPLLLAHTSFSPC